MKKLAVIIVSFNSATWLEPCLSSVYEHSGDVCLDVIVVDNDSHDGSAELVETWFPDVRVLRRPNSGFAAGNNAGLATVESPYVLFLNPDTEILEGTFERLVAILDDRREVGILGCRQVDTDGELLPTMRRFPSAIRYLSEALGCGRLGIDGTWAGEMVTSPAGYGKEQVCDWVSGSFLLANTDAVRAVGGFDERYFLYSEEPDLSLQLRRSGYATAYVPAMTIRHHAGKTGLDARLVAQDAYARKQYMTKNMTHLHRQLAMAAFAFGHALRAYAPWGRRSRDQGRRNAGRRAIATLYGFAPPPFGAEK